MEPHFIPVWEWESADQLPAGWRRGFEGWAYAKRLVLRNELDAERAAEPVEAEVEFHAGQLRDPQREIRVAAVAEQGGPGRELARQIRHLGVEDGRHRCRLWFLADLPAASARTWLILYGNSEAHEPHYRTDLRVAGEAYALTVENDYYEIRLAPTHGHLKSVRFRRGSASFSGYGPPMDPGAIGDGRHGVEGSVHWNPDWSDGHVGRYRVTNWTEPPEYEVVRGPVITRVERRGHPILGLGPLGKCEKVLARVAYTFWASTPCFLVETSLEVLEDVRFRDCRNDEWVGMQVSMPRQAWMTAEGKIGFGKMSWRGEDVQWLSFYNEENGDAFASLRLDYECSHPRFASPASVGIREHAWVRYPVRNALMRAGDFIREKNALLLHRYEPGRWGGFGMLMDWMARLRSPLAREDGPVAKKPLTRANVVDALGACRDLELYVDGQYDSRRIPGFCDLGLVRGVVIEGEDVRVDMVMPYAGRENWFDWFAETAETEIRRRIATVGKVEVARHSEPGWGPEQMTAGARRVLGL